LAVETEGATQNLAHSSRTRSQPRSKRSRARRTRGGIFFQRRHYKFGDGLGYIRSLLSNGRGRRVYMLRHYEIHAAAKERLTRQHLISDHSETVDIRTGVESRSEALFRRHIKGRAENCADLRETAGRCGLFNILRIRRSASGRLNRSLLFFA